MNRRPPATSPAGWRSAASTAANADFAAIAAAVASLALALVAAPAMAQTVQEIGERFSHAEWSAVLERFVDEKGQVDYEALSRDRTGLDAAMRELVEEDRNVAADPARQTVTLSKIFDWFEKDFLSFERANGNPNPTIVDYVNRYRASKPKLDRAFRVRYFEYDKRINGR